MRDGLEDDVRMTLSGWRAGGFAYVVAVTGLAGVATADQNHFVVWAWASALVLTGPALVLLIPSIYLVVPIVWHLTDIDHGGPSWPSMLAYMACFAVATSANVAFAGLLLRRRRARQAWDSQHLVSMRDT